MANLEFQNLESAICDVKFRVLARTSCSRLPLAHLLTAESGLKSLLSAPEKKAFNVGMLEKVTAGVGDGDGPGDQ